MWEEAELKIGRFGGSEQPALCEALKNTLRTIDILFAYHLFVLIDKMNGKLVTAMSLALVEKKHQQ